MQFLTHRRPPAVPVPRTQELSSCPKQPAWLWIPASRPPSRSCQSWERQLLISGPTVRRGRALGLPQPAQGPCLMAGTRQGGARRLSAMALLLCPWPRLRKIFACCKLVSSALLTNPHCPAPACSTHSDEYATILLSVLCLTCCSCSYGASLSSQLTLLWPGMTSSPHPCLGLLSMDAQSGYVNEHQ